MRFTSMLLAASVVGGVAYVATTLVAPAFAQDGSKSRVAYPGGVGVEWNCSAQPKGHWCHARLSTAERRAFEASAKQIKK